MNHSVNSIEIHNTGVNLDITIGVLCSPFTKDALYKVRNFSNFFGVLQSSENISYKIVFLIDEKENEVNLKIDKNYSFYKSNKVNSLKWIDYLYNEPNTSKWYLFVDLNSSTHIDCLRNFLDENYCYTDPCLLIDSKNVEVEDKQNFITRKIGEYLIPQKYNPFEIKNNFTLIHSKNSFILSNAAVNKIKNWSRYEQYTSLAQDYNVYSTHESVSIIAKYSKIPISETSVLSKELSSKDYSYLNELGRYHHVSNINRNISEYENFFKQVLDSQDPNSPNILHSYYKFDILDVWDFFGNNQYYGILYLREDGVIIGSCERFNETYWQKFEEHLVFLDKEKNVTCILYKIDQNNYEGPFILDPSSTHKITRIQ
jgi:hypothetical protein